LKATILSGKRNSLLQTTDHILLFNATVKFIAAKPEANQLEPLNSGALNYG
jgi:hypothetical protein